METDNKKIMNLDWTDEGDGEHAFTRESIGATADDDKDIADRLNTAAEYLKSKYKIDIIEARCRLWNQGDFYPRLELVETEIDNDPYAHRYTPVK